MGKCGCRGTGWQGQLYEYGNEYNQLISPPKAGGKVDGAQGVGVNATKVQEALDVARAFYTEKMGA